MKYDKSFWQKHIGAWEKSGLSQVGYCRQYRLNANYFSRMIRRWVSGGEKADNQRLVEVRRIPAVTGGRMELEVSGKFVLRIPEGISSEFIKQILDILEDRI